MNHSIDRNKTLDELDPPPWGKPEYDSYLVTTCYRLRRKKLSEFAVEDLRIAIGQRICLRWLVPLALEVLELKPLAEGAFYPGDLLASVLRIPVDFWLKEWEWRARVAAILDKIAEVPEELHDCVDAFRKYTI